MKVPIALALLFVLFSPSCASPRGGRGGGRGGRGGRRAIGGGGSRSSRASTWSSYLSRSSARWSHSTLSHILHTFHIPRCEKVKVTNHQTQTRSKPTWIQESRKPYMFTMDSVIEQVRAKKVSTWFGTKIQGAGWRPSFKKKNLGK